MLQASQSVTGTGDIAASWKNELCVLENCLFEWEKSEEQEPQQTL